MSVCVCRSCSASSATVSSLSCLSIESPPRTARALAGPKREGDLVAGPPRLGFRATRCQLSRAGPSCLRRNCFLRSLQLLHDVTRPAWIDVDPRAHRRRQRDRADVAALGRRRLGAHDLLDDGCVVLEQLALAEALLADRE